MGSLRKLIPGPIILQKKISEKLFGDLIATLIFAIPKQGSIAQLV
jgi:hypothetical protein